MNSYTRVTEKTPDLEDIHMPLGVISARGTGTNTAMKVIAALKPPTCSYVHVERGL